MSWEKTTVGEIVTTRKGYAFKSSKYVNKGVPVVRVSDYTMDSISDADLKYYPYDEKQNYIDYELHEKDVIVQTVGSWQNNPASVVGKVVRVPYFLEGALLNQNAVKIMPDEGIDNNFLFYRLKTEEFKGHVLGEARGAANQASITLDTIKSFGFLIPDCLTQKKIGNILSKYDELIENNRKQIKLLEETAQRLYKEWFVDLRFPGYEDCKIVDGVPVEWKKKKLDEIADVIMGQSPKSEFYNNPRRVDYYIRYQQIIEEYNSEQDRANIEKTFMELMDLANSMNEEEQRYVREGFSSDEELSMYDMLFDENLSKEDIKKIKKVAVDLLDKIKTKIAELDHWTDKQETKAEVDTLIGKILWEELPESYSDSAIFEYRKLIFEYVFMRYQQVA